MPPEILTTKSEKATQTDKNSDPSEIGYPPSIFEHGSISVSVFLKTIAHVLRATSSMGLSVTDSEIGILDKLFR